MYHIDEDLFPAFGALGGASGAFVLMYIDALAEAGVRAEFARPIAEEIATATVMGSGALAMNSSEHPIALMNAVCSPGGTTIAVCYCRDDAAKPTTSVGNAMPATASGTIPPAYRHAATHLPLHKGANGCVNVPLKK